MRHFFLLFTMLIISTEAFLPGCHGHQIPTIPGIKRKTSRSAGKVRWMPRMNSLSPARENEGPLTNFMSRKPLTNKMCRGGRKSSRRKVFKMRKESDGFGTESDFPHTFFPRVRFVKPAGGVRRSYDAMVKRQKQYTVPFRRKTPHHRFRSEKKEQKLKLSNFLKKRSAVESNSTDTPGGEILGESTESPLRDFRRTPDNSSVSAFQQPNPFSVGGDNPPNNPYLDVNYPSVQTTIFKSPSKPKIYESPFGSKSNLFPNPDSGKSQVLESSSESSSETVPHDLVKLKQVLEEVEKLLKEEDEEPSLHGEKGEKKKSGSNSSKTLEDDLKDEIQEAVPLLNKIAEDLLQEAKNGKVSPSSEKKSSGASKKKTTDTSEKESSEKSKKKEKGSSKSSDKKSGTDSKSSKKSSKSSKKDSVSTQKSRVIHTTSGNCSVDGTWSSQVLGTELGITIMPNMLLKVSVIPATQDTTINHKWSVQGLTLSKRGGPLILAAIYPQSRRIASFIGQCKTSMGQDLIFGSWMIFHHAPRIGDLWKALDVKMDVLKRVSADKNQIKQEKQEQKDRLTAEKKGGTEKLKGDKKGPKDKLKGDKKNQRQKDKMRGETNKS